LLVILKDSFQVTIDVITPLMLRVFLPLNLSLL